MNANITGMIEFVNLGTASTPAIGAALCEIGQSELRLVVIKVLAWIKSQKRIGKLWELELNEQYSWVQKLTFLVNEFAFLAGVVRIVDKRLILDPALNETELQEILAFVDANYQPRVSRFRRQFAQCCGRTRWLVSPGPRLRPCRRKKRIRRLEENSMIGRVPHYDSGPNVPF